MEGQETSDSDPHQGPNSKTIWPFAHIAMYMGLRVKSAYIHDYRFKIHVYQISHVFRDDLGNIKGRILVHGVQRGYRGTGKAINV